MKPLCENCRFYERNGRDNYGDDLGLCRRFPPALSDAMLLALIRHPGESENEWDSMVTQIDNSSVWTLPAISPESDWCGEFQPKEDTQ